MHFENDPTDYFTNRLQSLIEERGVLDLTERTITEKGRDMLNLRHRSYGSPEAAAARGKKLGVAAVLFGVIKSFESHPQGAILDVEVSLVDIDSGVTLFSKRYNESMPKGIVSNVLAGRSLSGVHWSQRFFAWFIIVLLLPVFSIGFIRSMLRKRSNRANAFVLSMYTLVDTLMAFLLVGRIPDSFGVVLVFLAAVAGAFIYNVQFTTFAARLEE